MGFLFYYNFCLKHFLFYEEFREILSLTLYISIQSTRYSCQILMKFEFPRQILEKY